MSKYYELSIYLGGRGNDSLPSENENEEYQYFSNNESVFSLWYPCTFVIGDKRYNCAQQYMMYKKAGSLYYLCRVIFLNQNCQSKSCSDFIYVDQTVVKFYEW